MDITVQDRDSTAIVAITGSVDALTAGELMRSLSEQIESGHKRLVADLSAVDFMSSAGLRAIIAGLKEVRQRGGDLRLAGAQPGIDRVLRISGLTTILKTFETVDQAVASFELS